MTDVVMMKYHDIGTDSLSGKRHFHNRELEILQIVSGDGVMMIKDKLYPLCENTVFFVCGKDAHYSSPRIPENYIRNKVVFSEELLLSLCRLLGCKSLADELFFGGGAAVKLSSDDARTVDRCFLEMYEAENKDEERGNISFAASLLKVLLTVSEKKNTGVSCLKNKISEVIEYINQNLCEKLSLDSLSKSTFISKYYLCHTFRTTVGMTVGEYITFSRISRSKQLLSESDMSISEIAAYVGFESFAYFSKVFREYEGMTPSAYRKRLRTQSI